MSLREFLVSLWHFRKRDARIRNEWLNTLERLQQLQGPLDVPSHVPSLEDAGQHPLNDHESKRLEATLP